MTARNQIDEEHDGIGDNKCPGDTNASPSNLFTQLNIMVVAKARAISTLNCVLERELLTAIHHR